MKAVGRPSASHAPTVLSGCIASPRRSALWQTLRADGQPMDRTGDKQRRGEVDLGRGFDGDSSHAW